MNIKAFGIVGGMIMVSAASFTIGANMTSIKGMVSETFPSEQPAEETAPVVTTIPDDFVLDIPTDKGMTFSVMRKNVSCKTIDGYLEGMLFRVCSAYGVTTDLAGNKFQYNEEGKYCFEKENQYANWTKHFEHNSLACYAAVQFSAS